jgi:ATPase components of ABC transporters with duplicated ATPase domains
VYAGNYEFWFQASQLNLRLKQSENKKITNRANELKAFIQRFSSNASKSKQATSAKNS